MRKHILGSVIFLSLVTGLHGMENNPPAERETPASREVKEGGDCTVLIPEPQPFFVSGFVMYPGGRLVPYTGRDQINFMLRMLRRSTPRKGLEPAQFKKIALPQPRQKQPRYRRPGEGLRPLPSENINLTLPLDIKISLQRRPLHRDQPEDWMYSRSADIIAFDTQLLRMPDPTIENAENPVAQSAEELRRQAEREAYENSKYGLDW